MFDREIHVTRRECLARSLGRGLVLLPGNADSPRNYADNVYPFRQDSTFLYYCGLDQPGLAAVLDLDAGTATMYGDELTIDDVVWTGDLPTIAERAESVGIERTRPLGDLAGDLAGRDVHYLPPYRAETANWLATFLDRPVGAVAAGSSPELVRAVIDQRAVKGPEEVAEIETAVTTAVAMHEAAIRMARPGLVEAEIAAEVERIALAAGGALAFTTIATVRGEVLHNHEHGRTMVEGDLFLLDAGAESPRGYASDLSSTFPVAPRFDDRQRTIYELQLAAQAAAVAKLGPGVPNREVHFAAARVIFDGLKDLGVFRGETDEALAAGAHAMVFPCGVGHMMGLDVHDMESLGEDRVGYGGAAEGTQVKNTQFGLKSLRLARELALGFTLTVEPGIYFIPQLMDQWRARDHCAEFIDFDELDRWRDFGGVRNEEDYLITADGARRLGPAKPLAVNEIESLRGGV